MDLNFSWYVVDNVTALHYGDPAGFVGLWKRQENFVLGLFYFVKSERCPICRKFICKIALSRRSSDVRLFRKFPVKNVLRLNNN